MSNFEILAVQTSLAAHPYYFISLCRRQDKLYGVQPGPARPPSLETHRERATSRDPPRARPPSRSIVCTPAPLVFETSQLLDQGNLNQSFGPEEPKLSFKFPAFHNGRRR